MSLDLDELTGTMVEAARRAVADRWPQMEAIAEVELRHLAQSIEKVAALAAQGKIDHARARHHAQLHQVTTRSVLTTVEGLGFLAAELATTAAVRSVAKAVNGIVKFALL